MKRPAIPVLTLCALCAAAPCAEPPQLAARVDRDEITVGDLFTLTIEVTRDPEVTIRTPLTGFGAQLQHFQVKDYQVLEQVEAPKGKVAEGVEYILSTYVSGDYPVPPVAVAYELPDGATGVVHTDVMTIHVKSVLPIDDTGLVLRDVRPPAPAPSSGAVERLVATIAAVAALVLTAVVGVLLWWRRRKRSAPPPEPAHLTAQRRLAELRASEAFQRGDARFVATELSELLRRYLGGRWSYNAIDLTTTEIVQSLPLQRVPEQWHHPLPEVLYACDRVKFADWPMTREELAGHLDLVEEFVRATVPAEQPQAEGGDG